MRFPSFNTLKWLSFAHSTVYTLLLIAWIAPGLKGPTMVLGWAHGILWIGMSLLMLAAARRHVVPFWLAVTVVVLGGLGPYAGSIGFVVAERRERRFATR
jgi:hypothetical protein